MGGMGVGEPDNKKKGNTAKEDTWSKERKAG